MVKRSKEEIAFLAYLLRALGLPCTQKQLLSCLDRGTRHGLWDGRIELHENTILWYDYDGGYYHTPDRVAHDTAKMTRKLAEDPCYRVLRVRANAHGMEVDEGVLGVAPFTTSSKPWEQLRDIRKDVLRLLPSVFASRLATASLQRDKVIDGVVDDVMLLVDKRYAHEFAMVENEVGKKRAKTMLGAHGVKTLLRAGLFVSALKLARTDLGLDAAQLVTFMCDSVAARLTGDGFLDALKRTGCKRKHVTVAIRAFPVKRQQ